MLSSNFLTLSMDLAFRCNYVAILEGLVAHKMVVDSIFDMPDLIPYWVKIIIFLIVGLPVPAFTLADDAIGVYYVYNRFQIH